MKVYKIETMALKNSYIAGFETRRDFVRVRGADSLRFLQGMWTSDLKLASSQAPAVGSSYLLNLKARPVAPALILSIDDKDFVVGVPEGWGQKVIEALDRYIVADDVELSLDTTLQAWTLFDSESVLAKRIAPRVNDDASLIFSAESLPDKSWLIPVAQLSATHLELWLSRGAQLPSFPKMDHVAQTSQRIDAGIPLWNQDLTEESLILEFPFAKDISFHKGCYIGQEVVARGTYRGQVPKGFARFESAQNLKEGGFIFREEDPSKPIGKMSTALGLRALGQIRLREIEGAKLIAETADGQMAPLLKIDLLHSKVIE